MIKRGCLLIKNSIAIVVVSVFIVCSIFAAGAYFYVTHANPTQEPGIMVTIGGPKEQDLLVINAGGINTGRFAKIGLVVEMEPKKYPESKDKKENIANEVKLRDAVMKVLTSQKLEQFDGKNREQLIEILKGEISNTFGDNACRNIFITNLTVGN